MKAAQAVARCEEWKEDMESVKNAAATEKFLREEGEKEKEELKKKLQKYEGDEIPEDEKTNQIQNLQNQIILFESERKELLEEIQNLKDSQEEMKRLNCRVKLQLDQQVAENVALKNTAERKEGEVGQVKNEASEAFKKVQDANRLLAASVASLKTQRTKLETEVGRLTHDVSQKRLRIQSLERENAKVAALQADVNERNMIIFM